MAEGSIKGIIVAVLLSGLKGEALGGFWLIWARGGVREQTIGPLVGRHFPQFSILHFPAHFLTQPYLLIRPPQHRRLRQLTFHIHRIFESAYPCGFKSASPLFVSMAT